MKKCILLILIFITTNIIFGQRLWDEHPNQLLREGLQCYKNGNVIAAIDKYNQVYMKQMNDPIVNYNMGTFFYKQGNFDTASYFFQNAIKSMPDKNLQSKAAYNLGTSMIMAQKYDKAVEALIESLKYNPNNDVARYNLAYALRNLKKQQKSNPQPMPNEQNTEKKQDKVDKNNSAQYLDALNNREKNFQKQKDNTGNNTKAKDW